jgi:hypothetical protein
MGDVKLGIKVLKNMYCIDIALQYIFHLCRNLMKMVPLDLNILKEVRCRA